MLCDGWTWPLGRGVPHDLYGFLGALKFNVVHETPNLKTLPSTVLTMCQASRESRLPDMQAGGIITDSAPSLLACNSANLGNSAQ